MIIKGKINKRSMDKQILKNVWLDIKNNTANRTEMNMFKKISISAQMQRNKKSKQIHIAIEMVRRLRGPSTYMNGSSVDELFN